MEDNNVKAGSNNRNKYLQLLLKITITIACLWYISKKLDFKQLSETLLHAKWLMLIYGVLLYMTSKVFASIRLNIYFRNINIHLPQVTNLKLYWLGLFYNLFLPGSISGDAYKVIRLTKQFGVPYKKTTSAVLLDRVTGLLGLGFVLALYGALVLNNNFYVLGLIMAAFVATAISYVVIKKWFPDFLPGFWPTFFGDWWFNCSQIRAPTRSCLPLALHMILINTFLFFL